MTDRSTTKDEAEAKTTTARRRRREFSLKFLGNPLETRRRDRTSALAKRVAEVEELTDWHNFRGEKSIVATYLRDIASRHSHLCYVQYVDLFVYHALDGYNMFDRRLITTALRTLPHKSGLDVVLARPHVFVPAGATLFKGVHPRTTNRNVYTLQKTPETTRKVKARRDALLTPPAEGHQRVGLTVMDDVFEREIARCKAEGKAYFATTLTVTGKQPGAKPAAAKKKKKKASSSKGADEPAPPVPLFAHANALIVDIRKRTLIRFEPHGFGVSLYKGRDVDDAFRLFVRASPSLDRYVAPADFTCRTGPQTIQERTAEAREDLFPRVEGQPEGFCLAYAMMFIDTVMAHPDWSYGHVADHLGSGDDLEVGRRARAYMQLVVDAAKRRFAETAGQTAFATAQERRKLQAAVAAQRPPSSATAPGAIFPPFARRKEWQETSRALDDIEYLDRIGDDDEAERRQSARRRGDYVDVANSPPPTEPDTDSEEAAAHLARVVVCAVC